ncbi:hypothetical protein MRX96_004858 [Rhipicephalus microplus]
MWLALVGASASRRRRCKSEFKERRIGWTGRREAPLVSQYSAAVPTTSVELPAGAHVVAHARRPEQRRVLYLRRWRTGRHLRVGA